MQIKCFETIDARTFSNWTWATNNQSQLSEFADYNLIYGWNGSGKTTLSDILRLVEKRQFSPPLSEGIRSFCIKWEDSPSDCPLITQQNILTPQQRLPSIRVFNRQYIDDAVYRSDDKGLAPIKIVVGDDAIKLKKEADRREAVLKTETDRLDTLRINLKNANNVFDKICTEKAKSIKDILPKIGKYGNYNKSHYKTCCGELLQAAFPQNFILAEAAFQAKKILAFSTIKSNLPAFGYVLPDLTSLLNDVTVLRKHIVAAKIIQTLAEKADIANWVEQGQQLHKKYSSMNCLYCELPVPTGRAQDIENHFSKEYESFTNRVQDLRIKISNDLLALKDAKLSVRAEFYDDMCSRYDQIESDFKALKEQVLEYLNRLLEILDEKTLKPFDNLTTEVAFPQFSTSSLDGIKKLIAEHNQRTSEFQIEINAACEAIEVHIVAGSLAEYEKQLKDFAALEQDIQALNAECEQANSDIEKLRRQVSSHKIPADCMNQDLKSYLGHDQLQLIPEDDGYRIMRGKVVATALSEGEKSAIAIIHFLRSLQSVDFDLKNGIVVIDDPVSSMDENALFHAYSFIKGISEEASQLIILTHNFPFFSLIKNWFFHAKRSGKTVSLYQAKASLLSGIKHSTIEKLPLLLCAHESEYHYLFSKVVEKSRDTDNSDLDASYLMPNVARRLLESFLAFRFPSNEVQEEKKNKWQRKDNMHGRLEKLSTQLECGFPDKEFALKIKRVDRFINVYSHELEVGQAVHDATILSETKSILVEILEIIEAADAGHYNGMMNLLSQSTSSSQPINAPAREIVDA